MLAGQYRQIPHLIPLFPVNDMETREKGFYWVQHEDGKWIVAELGRVDPDGREYWGLPWDEQSYKTTDLHTIGARIDDPH